MDWSREQFTMSPEFSRAVTKVFVDLYNEGLIYRDKRLVNWDPKLKTAISDLEVEQREVQGHFWHLRYPLADGVSLDSGADHIVVATTRPETMLADMAVAVHPDDARYKSVVGKFVELPITGRRVPVIADQHADPELGSGAVKITPGHDFNDFEVGRRAGIKAGEMLNMFDAKANVVQTADGLVPDELTGLDRFEARRRVATMLEEARLLGQVEDRTVSTPYGDRGGVAIEPWLTDQWYVDAKTLAQPAIEAVRDGRIEIVPESWKKTFFNWMENIQPWCISRQLWWGHRIPAWYGAGGQVYVAGTAEEASSLADGKPLARDPDVLDTWFSSALWPFATLGWPDDDAPLLKRHYPNDLLISGFDILFFWDARMAMMGKKLTGQDPWKRLYLHGLVRAADGQKMSKSKGNVVDPLILIDKYGADALRFFMAAMESAGTDVKMDEKRLEGYRNFATKLWNAARFCQANGIGASTTLAAPPATLAVNTWIIGEVVATLAELDKAMADLRFDAAANTIYHLVWDTFCDWYIELIKGAFDDETKAVAGWALDQILVMLHPFMPFVTEELWHAMGERHKALIVARWPKPAVELDRSASQDIRRLIKTIEHLRSERLAAGFKHADVIPLGIVGATDEDLEFLNTYLPILRRMARIKPAVFTSPGENSDHATWGDEITDKFQHSTQFSQTSFVTAQLQAGGLNFVASTKGFIDLDAERARLNKAIQAEVKERESLAKRLANPAFVEKAKPEAVEKARADHAAHAAEAERLEAALARLG